jgi:hypothetical protein
MNKIDPKKLYVDQIGELEVFDIFVEYDNPICFVCLDQFGSKYLFQEVFHDGHGHKWIFVKISRQRYEALKQNKCSLNKALSEPEEKKWYSCVDSAYNNIFEVITKLPDDIETIIKENETFVGTNVETGVDKYQTLNNAKERQLSTFDFAFNTTEKALFSWQKLVDLGEAIRLFFSKGKKTKHNFLFSMVPGSTILRFQIDNATNLLDLDSPREQIVELNKLFKAKNNDEIQEILKSDPDKIKRFSTIIDRLMEASENGVYIASATPTDLNANNFAFSHGQISDIRTKVNEITISDKTTDKFTAKLVGVISDYKKIIFKRNRRRESVQVGASLNLRDKNFKFETDYEFEVERVETRNAITNAYIKSQSTAVVVSIKPHADN